MKLENILMGLTGLKVKGTLEKDISNIQSNSNNITKGDMFIAIKGFTTDGHTYIQDALEKGATAIMVEEGLELKSLKLPEEVTLIVSPNTRQASAICACNIYKNPSKKFKLIGVTGTKGKTTTTFMIKSILEKQGKKVGLIGTIATYIGNKQLKENSRTTPDSIELQQTFAKMAEEKCEVVVMEVSSQSLKLHRVDGCEFDIAVFTNFSEDHISPKEHPDMEDYFNSKMKLFEMCQMGFVNIDDLHGNKIPNIFPENDITTYGIDNTCDVLAKDITITNSYVNFKVKIGAKNERIKTDIPGRFSVYNSLAAICVAQKLGCTEDVIKEALLDVKVPGRSELVENKKNLTIMIDYAHSPESLQSILKAVKSYTTGKVISVFGCGGDRDTSKRSIMGKISGEIADFTIITSDNPRTEEPGSIIKQIEDGMKKTNGKYICIENRKDAIKDAIKMANKQDIIVLAGKGHETYQEINGQKNHFDEREIIKEIIK